MSTSFRVPLHLAASPSFYFVHRSDFLASLFDLRSHSLQDCTTMKFLPRLETMAETTPLLLPRAYRVSHHIPSFLRVCHSPWPFLGQQVLLAVRATFAVFLSIVFILDIPYGINHTRRGKQLAFEASNVSLIIQICYYWTTTVGVSPLRCVNLLNPPTVVDIATYFGTRWSIASRETSQGEISSPDTSPFLSSNVN